MYNEDEMTNPSPLPIIIGATCAAMLIGIYLVVHFGNDIDAFMVNLLK